MPIKYKTIAAIKVVILESKIVVNTFLYAVSKAIKLLFSTLSSSLILSYINNIEKNREYRIYL